MPWIPFIYADCGKRCRRTIKGYRRAIKGYGLGMGGR